MQQCSRIKRSDGIFPDLKVPYLKYYFRLLGHIWDGSLLCNCNKNYLNSFKELYLLGDGSVSVTSCLTDIDWAPNVKIINWLCEISVNPGLFLVYFCPFLIPTSITVSISTIQLKKHRWCALDLNPWPQDGRRRQNHGAMVAALIINRFTCLVDSKPVK